MTENINLVGSDDVVRGGHIMQNAATEITQAVTNLDGVFERQRRFMEDWLERFEQILKERKGK